MKKIGKWIPNSEMMNPFFQIGNLLSLSENLISIERCEMLKPIFCQIANFIEIFSYLDMIIISFPMNWVCIDSCAFWTTVPKKFLNKS